ncbi:MAG: CotH kinase family protein [Saprospiraceae bacterium]
MQKFIFTTILSLYFVAQAQAQPGTALFDDAVLHEIRFTTVDTLSLFDFANKGDYFQCKVTIDGTLVDSIGVATKGNISWGAPNNKKPLKIKLNEFASGKKYDGMRRFLLHNSFEDPTMLREKLTYDICGAQGLHALRAAFAKVYINEVYWGVYTLVEAKDDLYRNRFFNKDGGVVESFEFADLCYKGDALSDYEFFGSFSYVVDNGDPDLTWKRFAQMLKKTNQSTLAQFPDTTRAYLHLDHWITYLATNVYLMNFDSYIQFQGNQLYFYDTLEQRFQVIPWDFNASFGLWNSNNHTVTDYSVQSSYLLQACLSKRVFQNPSLKSQYMQALCNLKNTYAEPDYLKARIDFFKNLLGPAVTADWRKMFSAMLFNQTLETGYFNISGIGPHVPGLKTFADDRYATVSGELTSLGFPCASPTAEPSASKPDILLSPNPTEGLVTLSFSKNQPESTLLILDALGRVLQIEHLKPEATNLHLDLSSLPSGVYFLKISSAASTARVIKL